MARLEGVVALDQLRVQLGNDIEIKAIREGKLSFPGGTVIALHWNEVSSDEDAKVLAISFPGARLQSSVPESAVNVQFIWTSTTLPPRSPAAATRGRLRLRALRPTTPRQPAAPPAHIRCSTRASGTEGHTMTVPQA